MDTAAKTFLNRLDMGKYIEVFAEGEIDYTALTLLSDADFKELGVPKGPRVKLMNGIRRAVESTNASLQPEPETMAMPSPVDLSQV